MLQAVHPTLFYIFLVTAFPTAYHHPWLQPSLSQGCHEDPPHPALGVQTAEHTAAPADSKHTVWW